MFGKEITEIKAEMLFNLILKIIEINLEAGPFVEMIWLKVEPPFEPLRSDPRWQEMLDKVGFPE